MALGFRPHPYSCLAHHRADIGTVADIVNFCPRWPGRWVYYRIPAAADQIWYQSVGRTSATATREKSSLTDLTAGWTDWTPSW